MSSNQFVNLIAIFAIIIPTVAMATEHIVGDEVGWTVNFNYQDWAKDKEFRVGDTLVFKYVPSKHNVFKVNKTEFDNCIVPPANESFYSGNDKITLSTTGKKWYICGIVGEKSHCADLGQKLAIDVVAETPPLSAAFKITSSNSLVVVAVMVLVKMITL